ncbi:hypothetical protein F4813DRAFT_303643 [Daldinia decipiens]|uniref:uncharacterized protein n=1 Tax=Daldinia decipiens TaxID=326647 RepID=UPI0020C2A1B3|nr:uncharacterized protein F4813DRAFT_303643 [Daldinia decipiens]KAI1652663.1 hypothetical protein F4813DRAFT_303643 [Daldinia decipiens]
MTDLDFSSLSSANLEIALNSPALKPPDGVKPNFEHPLNKNTISLVSIFLCFVVGSTFLGIRIYMIFFKMRQQHIADYLMILAYPCWVITAVGSLRRIFGATGIFIHEWDFRGRDIAAYIKVIFMGMCFWAASTALMKSAILLEWIHIFSPTNTRTIFHRSCKILLIFTPLFYASLIIALNLSCTPYERIWDKTVAGTCIDLKAINIAATATNVVLDIAILILPQRIIWKLKMSNAKKIGISAVFAVGIFACIAAIGLFTSMVNWVKSNDLTYHYSAVALWAIAESTCGTMIFCAPVIPKLFKGLKLKWASTVNSWVSSPVSYWVRRSAKRRDDIWTPAGLGSDPRQYRHIDESNSTVLGRFETARPTDQQYGIVCTTDILVTESRGDDFVTSQQDKQNPWLPSIQENRV